MAISMAPHFLCVCAIDILEIFDAVWGVFAPFDFLLQPLLCHFYAMHFYVGAYL